LIDMGSQTEDLRRLNGRVDLIVWHSIHHMSFSFLLHSWRSGISIPASFSRSKLVVISDLLGSELLVIWLSVVVPVVRLNLSLIIPDQRVMVMKPCLKSLEFISVRDLMVVKCEVQLGVSDSMCMST
jgi:hypothetical protein